MGDDSDEEQKIAHEVIAYFFDRPVRDMGGGLRIVELPQKWMDAKWADLIKKAVRTYALTSDTARGEA